MGDTDKYQRRIHRHRRKRVDRKSSILAVGFESDDCHACRESSETSAQGLLATFDHQHQISVMPELGRRFREFRLKIVEPALCTARGRSLLAKRWPFEPDHR